jgi:hypothetical protein
MIGGSIPSGSRLAITSTPPSPRFCVTVLRYPIARIAIHAAVVVLPLVVERPPDRSRGVDPRCASEDTDGMVTGMASRKLTITLDEAQVLQIRDLVSAGRAASVSGFVQHAVGVALDDVAGWGAMLARALDDTGGPMSAEERAWADTVLGVPKRRRRPAA